MLTPDILLEPVVIQSAEDLDRWIASLRSKIAEVLKRGKKAVNRGYLERNPASNIKQVREPERSVRVLTAEEVGKLLLASPSLRWKVLIALGITTGMRRGEMLALRWEDMDLRTQTVWVRNKPGHLTKSRRNRVLALVPEVCELLMQLPRSGELIFYTRDGKRWRNNLQRDFACIVKKAGIKACTIHDLRRTFVSHLAMAGVNEATVQKLAGHASISTTIKYYTDIMPEALRRAQDRLPFKKVLRIVSDSYHGVFMGRRARTA